MSIFSKALNVNMAQEEVSAQQVADGIDPKVSVSQINIWRRPDSNPTLSAQIRVSNFFNKKLSDFMSSGEGE
ncbi:hypothetical protein KAR91_54430 [Candidatus Pacearchaeota archaeon]|nr:hypothetical protein [Candidatus Pacearchaeota archaeon]